MGTQKTRTQLENAFSAGKTPSGSDYSDLFASFYNKSDDTLPTPTIDTLKIGKLDKSDEEEIEIDGDNYYFIPLYNYNNQYDIVIVAAGSPSDGTANVYLGSPNDSLDASKIMQLSGDQSTFYIFIKGYYGEWVAPANIYPTA